MKSEKRKEEMLIRELSCKKRMKFEGDVWMVTIILVPLQTN